MSLSACNGLFENIYDAPTETEMEIKENSFSQIKTVEYTEFNEKYNQRDITARQKMRQLVDSDANRVTKVFSTLFEE